MLTFPEPWKKVQKSGELVPLVTQFEDDDGDDDDDKDDDDDDEGKAAVLLRR